MPVKPRPSRVSPFSSGEQVTSRTDYRVENPNQFSQFFEFFGLTLKSSRSELNGNCPFPTCQNPVDHFYANSATGQWKCHRCAQSGNVFTFMRKLHEAHLSLMQKEDYKWLRQQRPGISTSSFRKYQVTRFGPSTVAVPSFPLGDTAKISSLPLWRELTNKGELERKFLNPPTLKVSLFGLQFVNPKKRKPIYICEGQWDAMALDTLTSQIPSDKDANIALRETIDIIAVAGASGFPRQYLSLLDARDVYVLYDNDDAGIAGTDRLRHLISEASVIPLSIHRLDWPSTLPEGFDIRDLSSSVTKA